MTPESSARRTRFFKVRLECVYVLVCTATDGGPPKNSKLNGHHDTVQPSIRGSSETQQTINVVLFGETGVGKSSVINLIARENIAKVSSDVNGCTMQYNRYSISFDNMDFAIFDTIGLDQPQMAGYLQTMEKAYELVRELSAAGGIHLLLFCMRGGRMTATARSNYQLFYEYLCNTKVPIALVFTGLEREVEMEDWWNRNKPRIEQYGIKSDGHACVTAVQDDGPEDQRRYEKSQETIRELLKSCASKGETFLPESCSWFAGFLRKMKSFAPAKKSPKNKDIVKVLTTRCKLDAETAKRIAEMMDKGDKDKVEGAPLTMNYTSPGEEDAKAMGDSANGVKEVTQDGGPPQELGNIKAVPGAVPNGGKAALQEPRDAKASPSVVPVKEIEVADAGALLQEPSNVKAPLGVLPGKEVAKKNVVDTGALQDPSSVKAPLVVPNGGKDADGPVQESRSVKAPSVVLGKEVAKKNAVDVSALQDPSSVNAPLVVPKGGKDVDGPAQESRSVKAPAVPGKEIAKKNVVDAGALQDPSNVKAPLVVREKNVYGPVQESRSVEAPPVLPRKEAAKKYVANGIKALPGVSSGGNDVTEKVVDAGTLLQERNGGKDTKKIVAQSANTQVAIFSCIVSVILVIVLLFPYLT